MLFSVISFLQEIHSVRHEEQEAGHIYDYLNHDSVEPNPPSITPGSPGASGHPPQLPERGGYDHFSPEPQHTYTRMEKTPTEEHRYLQLDWKKQDDSKETNNNDKNHEYFTLERESSENGHNTDDEIHFGAQDGERNHDYFVLEPSESTYTGNEINGAQIADSATLAISLSENNANHEYFVLEPENNETNNLHNSGVRNEPFSQTVSDNDFEVLEQAENAITPD